ncbi:MAG: FAD-dependent monooxygenase, partial [Chloroflexi bacterium]|nr:FAD-dependent monooxygenase [Chloroflexota bacterium]
MTSVSAARYDAIVAGGSAAGLFAAARLAQAGARVIVLERASEVGAPTRTLIVTRELERVLGFRPAAAIVHEVTHMDMHSRARQASVTLREPDWIIDRGSMNRLLLERAAAAGAEVALGTALVEVRLEGGAVQVTAAAQGRALPLTAPVLIGADGVRSDVARALGFGPTRSAPLLQARIALPPGYDPSRVRIWFDRALTNYFLWLIPDSETTAVLGLVAERDKPARLVLDAFLQSHGVTPLEYQGAVIPLHMPWRQLERRAGKARALLVGDAAAHVKVTTVGGLVSGLLGARAAAEAVITGRPYAQTLAPLQRELLIHNGMRWALDRFADANYDRLLGGLA